MGHMQAAHQRQRVSENLAGPQGQGEPTVILARITHREWEPSRKPQPGGLSPVGQRAASPTSPLCSSVVFLVVCDLEEQLLEVEHQRQRPCNTTGSGFQIEGRSTRRRAATTLRKLHP